MNMPMPTFRRRLARWAGWFFSANTLFFLLVGLSYVPYIQLDSHASSLVAALTTMKGDLMVVAFTVFAFIGQAALLSYALCAIVLVLALIYPKRRFIFTVAIILSSLAVTALIADALVFHLYRYHLAGLIWHILMSGAFSEVIVLSPLEYMLIAAMMIVIALLQYAIAKYVWINIRKNKTKYRGKYIAIALVSCLFLSYALYFSASDVTNASGSKAIAARANDHLIIMAAQKVPYYYLGNYQRFTQLHKQLHYPKHTLRFRTVKQPFNIVIIAIDTWRFDMMNRLVTPNIYRFSLRAWNFKNNYSGGNATQPGIYSLFYSLSPMDWTEISQQKISPVLIDQLIRDHYQMRVFASASLEYPDFDKTVFKRIKDLQINTPGNTPAQRDREITNEFMRFIKTRKRQQPFFSFLFYDSVHGYCQTNRQFPTPFQPEVAQCNRIVLTNNSDPVPYLNRYKNAVLYDDSLVGKALDTLKKQGLLKNTVVVITADHGEEFNDEHLDYWGHASGFDPYQVRTPLIVYWPGKQHKVIHYQTSHYDIVPTLMRKVLGCTNPLKDYSTGSLLTSKKRKHYLLVGSYVNFAILQKHRTTVVYPGGNFDITKPSGHLIPNAKLNKQVYRFLSP